MWKQTGKISILLALVAVFVGVAANSHPVSAATGINQQMAFEGKLVNSNGTNITNGTYNMEFKIYKNGTSTGGGTLQWTEDYLVGGTGGVTFTDGTFAVNLGANSALSSVDFNSDTLWLSLQVGNTSSCTITTTFQSNCSGDGEMSPYIRLTAVPYAFNALQLGGVAAAGYGTLAGTQTWAGTNSFTNSIAANGGLGITGLTTQSYGSAVTGNADSRTITNSNASSTLSTVNGLNIQLVGGTNSNANKNALNAINFPNVTTVTNNIFTGLNFGTGYNSLLSYNGNTVINGTGVVQTAFGGTGVNTSAAVNGTLLIGNGSGLSQATLANNGGITITNGAGTIGLAVAYGSSANQAVQGNVTLTCPTVSGNLAGGGGTITLGTGGSCTGITFSASPTFTGLTSPSINTTAGTNTAFGNGTGTFQLDSTALDVSTAGALSGITSIGLSGAISGATSTNTINGLIINSGALSGVTGIATSGAYTQTGSNSNAFTGPTSVTNTLTLNTGTANQLLVTSGTNVPTADQLSITNTASTGVTTAGINGLSIAYKGGAAAVEAAAARIDLTPGTTSGGTWNGLRVVSTGSTASGVIQNGLKIDAITAGSGTDNALSVGTGWTSILSYNGTQLISGTGIIVGSVNSTSAITTSATGATALAVTGAPALSGTSSLAQFGGAISGGNASGTYLGINEPAAGAGSAADFLNFQNNSVIQLQVTSGGALTLTGAATLNGGATVAGNTSLGSVGSSTASSTINVANTSSGTGTQTVSIGSNANAANALTLEAGNSGKIQIGNSTAAHTINIGAAGATAGNAETITIGSGSTTTASLLTLNGGNITTTNGNAGILIGGGFSASDTNLVGLTLDSSSTFTETASTCTSTVNGGALYFNSASDTVRACIPSSNATASWEDLVSTSGLGVILFGVVPDSAPNLGSAGDLAGTGASGANGSGPCKVYLGSTTAKIRWTSCVAYSAGRKIVVAAQTTDFTIPLASSGTQYDHICLNGTGNQPVSNPATSGTGAENANLPAFSANNPVLCIADVLVSTTVATGIYDVRTFTTSIHDFVNISSATTVGLGSVLIASTTNAITAGTGTTTGILGVVVAWGGATTGTPNAIITVEGPTWAKATAGTAGANVTPSAATAGRVITGGTPAGPYGYLGIQRSINWSNTCTAGTASTCQTSDYFNMQLR